jgi:hypothetical protein
MAIIDTFNRADGGLGANWTTLSGLSAPRIVSNECAPVSGGGSSGAMYNAQQFDSDCYAVVDMPATAGNVGVFLRIPTRGNHNGYYAEGKVGLHTKLYRIDNGTPVVLGANITTAWAAGDSLWAMMIGSTLLAWRRPARSTIWDLLGTRTDSTYTAGGNAGIFLDTTGTRIGSFGAGSFAPDAP